MSKFLRTAGEIIAVAVAVAAAIPSGGTSLLAGALSVSAGTASAIAAGVSVSITALEALTAKKPTSVGNPSDWKADPNAAIPHIAGRMYFGGQITYRNTWGKDAVNETFQTIYSTGPIKGFESLYVDNVATAVDGSGVADINDRGKMYASTQLGQQPEASQLGALGPPNFTAQSKLSGLAASSINFIYDTKGGHTFTTEPQCGYVVLGTPVYDPRQDSTYPGGNGTQRSNDETTWSFTGYDNPGLKALSFLIGYRQKGNVVIGVGLPISAIRVDQLVEMANVCDANGWKMGGVIMSTDDRWTMYGQILQAGGAVPTRSGTRTGCIVNTPKVSLATFERDDIIGDWSIQGSTSRRARINAIVPSYMAEQSVVGETSDANGNTVLQTTVTWGMAAAGIIIVNDYVTFDGGQRQKAVSYPFVTGHTTTTDDLAPNQVAQLARYDIENSREFGPISMTMKPRWMGYQAGDVITGGASTSEMGLVGQDIMLLQRSFSPANMTVSMTARSETKAKHAFALGQTTTPPPTPSLSGPPLIAVPGADAWALTAGELTSENGSTSAALFLNGTSDSSSIDAVVVEMRVSTGEQAAADDWEGVTTLAASFSGQLTITSVKDQTAYQVAVSYRKGVGTGTRLILGPATAGQTAVPWSAGVVGPGKPADNATNSADPLSAFGTQTVAEVTASLADLAEAVPAVTADVGNLKTSVTTLDSDVAQLKTDVPDLTAQVSAIADTQIPDLSAAVEIVRLDTAAAQAQIETSTDALAQSLLRALGEADRTRTVMRDAGIYIDPATGTARIYATDQQADRLSQVSVALDAVAAQITLAATVDYVNDQIALAQIDPGQAVDLSAIIAQITSAQVAINGLNATVALKADATTLTGLAGTVNSLSTQLDGLAGTITTKADSTTVDALGTELASVQETVTAFGNVSSLGYDLQQAYAQGDAANAATLAALLAGDAASQRAVTQQADLHFELTTSIVAGLSAEASARLALAAEMNGNQASALVLIQANATATDANTSSLSSLQASVSGQAAEIEQLASEQISAGTSIAGISTTIRQAAYGTDADASTALATLLAGDNDGRNKNALIAQVHYDLTTTIVAGQSAQAAYNLSLLAQLGAAQAAISNVQTALATLDFASTDQITAAESAIAAADARIATEETTRADADSAQSTRIDGLSATISDPTTGLAATRAAINSEATTRADGDSANATAISGLSAQVNDPTTGLPKAHADILSEQTARADADSAQSQRVDGLEASLGTTNASIEAESAARVNADSAQAQQISQINAAIDDPTTGLSAASASIAAEATARVAGDGANAEQISAISAQVNNPTTGLAAAFAAVGTAETASADADTALGSRIDTVTASIAGVSGEVSTLQSVTADLSGKVTARFQEIARVDGDTAGVIATVEQSDGTTTSNLALIADAIGLWVKTGDETYLQALGVDAQGVVRIYAKLLANSIETDMLVVNAAVVPAFVYTNTPVSGVGWDASSTGSGGVGGGSGSGGGSGGGAVP